MSGASSLGKRYAQALLELAVESNQVESVGRDLTALVATWQSSRELRETFVNPRYGADVRRRILDDILAKSSVSPLLQNTLRLLGDRRRLMYLPDIADAYALLAEARSGKVRAEVVTATALPDSYFAELTATLERVTGKKITLVRKVDPSIIGGVVTRVGDRVFDGSLKNQLHLLEEELLTR